MATQPKRRHVRVWREHHVWCLRASMQRLAARPMSTFLTVLVMGFALALPLAFWLVLGNMQQLAGTLGRTQAINVFMQTDVDPDAVKALAARLRARDDTSRVAVKSPDEGMRELASMQGFAKALDTLDYNPLPYVLVVEPRAHASADVVEALSRDLRRQSGVDQVQDDGAWRQRLDALVDVGRRVVVVLALLLALAAVLVVGNSVRLDIQSRAEELGVLRLVGASAAFVRRPYLYAGVWYGLASGLTASLLVLLAEAVLAGPVGRLLVSYGGRLDIGGLAGWQLTLVPILAAALGWLGARLVSGHWLRRMA